MSRSKRKMGPKEAADAARPYVQKLIEDDDLRDNLREAYEAARDAYGRAVDGKGAKAVLDDERIHSNLSSAAQSLRSASDALRETEAKGSDGGGAFGKVLVVAVIGAILALVVSEDLRKKILDQLFGAEEDFEYVSTTAPGPAPTPVAPPAS